jgi:hypothetical protein
MESTILGSIGGAVDVAHHAGGLIGQALSAQAGSAFIGGMDLALRAAAVVALAGALVALLVLPARQAGADETEGDGEADARQAIV